MSAVEWVGLFTLLAPFAVSLLLILFSINDRDDDE
jgi:hypothetical protein